jgi:hypothetical protein
MYREPTTTVRHRTVPLSEMKGAPFLMLPPLLERAFSLTPWLLLNLPGLNWGQLEILEKTQDRQIWG